MFARNGFSPDNVLCEDFFSPTLDRLAATFDLVASFGFVEHFADPLPVIKRHIEFFRPKGNVAVVIPNLQGIYHVWNAIFNPRLIEIPNAAMMGSQAVAFP